jgi:hypothetical protein
MSETPRRKLKDAVDTIKRAIETRNLVNALTMLENIAKEFEVYVKLRAEEVLMLFYDELPYGTGYQITIVLRSGVAVVYNLYRYEDYIEKAHIYAKSL